MKALTSSLLLVLALTACDRRDEQPVEPASTTDTATANAPAAAPADGATVTTPDTMSPGMVSDTGACQGLTGQAQTDCLNNTGPAGNVTPAPTTPPTTDPTAPTAPTDASTPPPGTTEDPAPTAPPQS